MTGMANLDAVVDLGTVTHVLLPQFGWVPVGSGSLILRNGWFRFTNPDLGQVTAPNTSLLAVRGPDGFIDPPEPDPVEIMVG